MILKAEIRKMDMELIQESKPIRMLLKLPRFSNLMIEFYDQLVS